MSLKNLSKEELENMSYDDIAYALLTDSKKAMKIIDLFTKVAKLANLDESAIEENIGDFFEMLTLDKRFIMLDDGSWDLRDRHAQKIIMDEDEDDINIEEIDKDDEEDSDEDIFYDEDGDDDEGDDDLKDLVIIDDEEEEESNF